VTVACDAQQAGERPAELREMVSTAPASLAGGRGHEVSASSGFDICDAASYEWADPALGEECCTGF
jgi:hypothetical protein